MDTDEYRRSSAAVGSNAIGAWQQGATGRGVTIGFVDTGLDPSLSDFAGRIDSRSDDFAGSRPMGDAWGHGTAVAGIAAAARDGHGIQGIAYEATIFMARADHGCPSDCMFDSDDVAQGIDAARQSGAKVINISIGGGASSNIASAVKRAADAGIIIVVGAGNEGTQPSGLAQQLASVAPLNVIIVGALGITSADGTINYDVPAKWTTPAADSLNSFLTAPGWLNGGTNATSASGYDLFSGTSFSSPVVAGAVALLLQAFPTLTAQQLVTLLYLTADDLGAGGVDSVYGRGRLNIGRAFQPVGSLRMANNDQPVAVDQSAVLPVAAGDAGRHALLSAMALDEFDRAFEINVADSIKQGWQAGPLARSILNGDRSVMQRLGPISMAMTVAGAPYQGAAMQQLNLTLGERQITRLLAANLVAAINKRSHVAIGFGIGAVGLRQSFLRGSANRSLLVGSADEADAFSTSEVRSAVYQYRAGPIDFSVSGETGKVQLRDPIRKGGAYSSLSASIEYQALDGHIGATVSHLAEKRSFLGGNLPKFVGEVGSQTYFADFHFNRELGRAWTLSAAYRRGWTQSEAGHFTTSSFSADVTKSGVFSSRDQLAIRVSQPLRIEHGGMNLLLPTAWDYTTERSSNEFRRLSLSPSGREITGELGYSRPIQGGWIRVNAFGRRNPSHVRGADVDLGLAIRLQTNFGE